MVYSVDKILGMKFPMVSIDYILCQCDLVAYFSYICWCKAFWFFTERYIPFSFPVKTHHAIKSCTRQKNKIKWVVFGVKSIFHYTIVSVAIFFCCGKQSPFMHEVLAHVIRSDFVIKYSIIKINDVWVSVPYISASANSLSIFLGQLLNMFLLSSLTMVVIAFIVIYFVTARMVKPLRDMLAATQSFSRGDYTVRVQVNSSDEIGQLANEFNYMAEALARNEAMNRSFVANVSHELKTPMTTIGGFVDGILDGTIPKEKHHQYLAIVSGEVKRLSRMVRSMLDLAKIEAGEMKLNPAEFDLNNIVCQVIFSFEQAIESKNLDILGLDVDKIMVSADPDLMHQVIYNLIENAVKFVNEGGYIEVKYHNDGARTLVAIRNSGTGIAPQDLPNVFERFYKTDRSRSQDKTGVGLGLYIVRTVIQLHGGEIHVSSKEGEYTEFAFSVPSAGTKNSQNLFRKNG